MSAISVRPKEPPHREGRGSSMGQMLKYWDWMQKMIVLLLVQGSGAVVTPLLQPEAL